MIKWRKSTYSGPEQGACVEVAGLSGSVAIRDSKHPETGHFTLARTDLKGVLGRIKVGDLDL